MPRLDGFHPGRGREALSRIEASQGLRIERIPGSVFLAGKNEVYVNIDGLSLVDAPTVARMRHRGLSHIYSLDDDFDRVPEPQREPAELRVSHSGQGMVTV